MLLSLQGKQPREGADACACSDAAAEAKNAMKKEDEEFEIYFEGASPLLWELRPDQRDAAASVHGMRCFFR
jgi:hypothetical protein